MILKEHIEMEMKRKETLGNPRAPQTKGTPNRKNENNVTLQTLMKVFVL